MISIFPSAVASNHTQSARRRTHLFVYVCIIYILLSNQLVILSHYKLHAFNVLIKTWKTKIKEKQESTV